MRSLIKEAFSKDRPHKVEAFDDEINITKELIVEKRFYLKKKRCYP